MTIRIVHMLLYSLLALILLGTIPGLAEAAPQVIEAVVLVPPAKQPALYLRFRNNKLWMAATQEGLEKATSIRAVSTNFERPEEGGFEYRYYNFPEVDWPFPTPGFEKVRVTFSSSREIFSGNDAPPDMPKDQTRIVASYTLSRRDRAGVSWTYSLYRMVDCPTEEVTTKRFELTLPPVDPDALTLEIETKVDARNAGIGLRVKSGDIGLDHILKGEAKAPAAIEIVDLEGKTVVSEKGDLEKFGFT